MDAGQIVGVPAIIQAIGAALPAHMWRSGAAVSNHAASGLLPATRDRFGRLVTTPGEIVVYGERLAAHSDGRLTRFNSTGARPFRAVWYRARHRSEAEFGRLASAIAAAKGKRNGRPSELDDDAVTRIRDMAARGLSQRAIAQNLRLSRGQVQRVLASQGVSIHFL